MRKFMLLISLFISITILAQQGNWNIIGNLGTGTFDKIFSLKTDRIGNVYAAGGIKNSNNEYYVAKYNGINWTQIGTLPNAINIYSINDIAVDSFLNVFITLRYQGLNNDSFHIYKWNGSIWKKLGRPIKTPINDDGYGSSICVDKNNNVYTSNKMSVFQFDGTDWQELLSGFNNLSLSYPNDYKITKISTDKIGNLIPDLLLLGNSTFQFSNSAAFYLKWDGNNWNKVYTGRLFSDSSNNIETHFLCNEKNDLFIVEKELIQTQTAIGSYQSVGSNIFTSRILGNNINKIDSIRVKSYYGTCIDSFGAGYIFFQDTSNIHKFRKSDIGITISSNLDSLMKTTNSRVYAVTADIKSNGIFLANFSYAGSIYVAKFFSTTLPLKLLSFNAQLQTPNSVALNWQTANEVNVSDFTIQRSNNGKDFTSIGKVNASCCSYEFIDDIRNLEFGIRNLYYRLEIVDKDGSKTYSETKSLNIQHSSSNIIIYPNPAKDQVTIECDGARELLIIDYLGKEVYRKKIFNNQLSIINVQQFAKGIYVVKIMRNNGEIKNEKLVVE